MTITENDDDQSGDVADGAAPRRRLGKPIPAEGENGLYTQSWFPICYSHELTEGTILGRQFLGGKVIAFRDTDGSAVVTSAYCAHVGADLSGATMCEGRIRCAFHFWEYDGTGHAVRTGVGDAAPKNARLFRFPVREHYGMVLAFNGIEPTWEPPTMKFPESDVVMATGPAVPLPTPPWVNVANTPDYSHFKLVHAFDMDLDKTESTFEWHGNGSRYMIEMSVRGHDYVIEQSVWGTSCLTVQGTMDGEWFGQWVAWGLPGPSGSVAHAVTVVEKRDGTDADQERAGRILAVLGEQAIGVVMEDQPILDLIHFRPGVFTRADRHLAQFLEHVRNFPRANAAHDFLN